MFSKRLVTILSLTLIFCSQANALKFRTPNSQEQNKHTGFFAINIDTTSIKRVWQQYIGEIASSGPSYRINAASIGKENIYVSRNNYVYSNTLQAFSIETGNLLWGVEFDALQAQPPVYHDGKLFIQTLGYYGKEKSSLRAYNTSGELIFQTEVSDSDSNVGAPIVDSGIIYAETGQGSIKSYSETTGERLASYKAFDDDYKPSSPALLNNWLISYSDGKLHIFDRDTTSEVASIADPNYSWPGSAVIPIITDDHSALIYSDWHLKKINLLTQQIDFDIPNTSGKPAVDDKFIYTIKNQRLTAIDKMTGKAQWVAYGTVFKNTIESLIVTNNVVFVSDVYGTSAISKNADHSKLWRTEIHGKISLSRKGLFIVSNSGELTAFKFNETE